MTSKVGFDPSQTCGVQAFQHLDRYYRICFYGSGLEHVRIGEKVLFQNQAGKYWIGIIERDCFMFIGEEAFSTVLDALGYDGQVERMKELAEQDDWFCDQGELPF
ncbi:hypothetical protein [Phytobacter massiliensis]|uniref:hypothetical protein n=1 Tax=Phytobacter massiliensis TaxID=1485952 RepID=UPI0005C57A85|nr:hypothetical protein [Phytobacter massiliensis]